MKLKLQFVNRSSLKRLAWLGGFLVVIVILLGWTMLKMPGKSYQGQLPPLTPAEAALAKALEQDVTVLATDIGIRNFLNYSGLMQAVAFLEQEFTEAGYVVKRQGFEVEGQTYYNLEVEIQGSKKPDEIVVVGGHYDSVYTSPAANDNGSGTAVTLALAKHFATLPLEKTLRFVAFVNEEPPFFQTENMGSWVYADRCKQREENIIGMISLETMGYYSDEVGSQQYPTPLNLFYPLQGNFIAFVSNLESGAWLRQVIQSFRQQTQFPSEGAAVPSFIPGAGWSDHWSFWQQGYPALMVTDTAPFRYPYYHTSDDTPDKIDYERLARVVMGLARVLEALVGLNPIAL